MNIRYLILTLTLAACSSNKVDIPKGVLPKDKMAQVVADIQLLEAVHKDMGVFGIERKHISDTSFMIVYNKHKISVEQFDSSYSFYTRHPELFAEVMEEVEENLSKRQ